MIKTIKNASRELDILIPYIDHTREESSVYNADTIPLPDMKEWRTTETRNIKCDNVVNECLGDTKEIGNIPFPDDLEDVIISETQRIIEQDNVSLILKR